MGYLMNKILKAKDQMKIQNWLLNENKKFIDTNLRFFIN
jgi:hypothetical protein